MSDHQDSTHLTLPPPIDININNGSDYSSPPHSDLFTVVGKNARPLMSFGQSRSIFSFPCSHDVQMPFDYAEVRDALNKDDAETLIKLSSNNSTLFTANYNQSSYKVLHIATESNSVKCIAACLANISEYTDDNYLDIFDRTPLFYARSGIVAEMLINAGAKVNVQDHRQYTPLHTATTFDRLDVVKVLITIGGADTDAIDDNGNTALDIAIHFNDDGTGLQELVDYLHSVTFPDLEDDDEDMEIVD